MSTIATPAETAQKETCEFVVSVETTLTVNTVPCRRLLWLMRLFLAWSLRAPWFSCHTNRSSQSQERGESWLWCTGKYTVFENGTCKMGEGRIEECVFGCLCWPERTPGSYETQDLNWPDTFLWIYCQKKSNNTAWEQSKSHKSRQVSVIEIPRMPWCTEEQA